MIPSLTVSRGETTIRLVRSPLYLGDAGLYERLRAPDAVSAASETSGGAADAPAIGYFTIPGHLHERLWLEDIPAMTGAGGSRDPDARGGWRAADRVTMLLQTLDPGFAGAAELIFHAAAAPGAGGANDICEAAAARGGPEHWAWLNMDDRDHLARIGGPQADDAIELGIAAREGIVWRRGTICVAESPYQKNWPQTKLLLRTA